MNKQKLKRRDIGLDLSVRPSVCPSDRPSVRPSVRLSHPEGGCLVDITSPLMDVPRGFLATACYSIRGLCHRFSVINLYIYKFICLVR